MANDILNIDNYFQEKLSAEERVDFEKKLADDPSLAADVAFYVHTKLTQREQTLNERHAEWTNRPKKNWLQVNLSQIAIGVAAMLLMVTGIWFFTRSDIQQRADTYIKDDLESLQGTMDDTSDSLKLGIKLYNDKKYAEARVIFEKLIDKSPDALEFAGLSAFKMNDYDAAMSYFEKIEQNTELITNKGKFYIALVNIKQGKIQEGEHLLKEVIDQNLGGKTDAEEILE